MKNSIKSIGGLTVLPDYDLVSAPADYEGLLLIGGMSWRTEAARQVAALVKKAVCNNKVVGGICDAAAFLGTAGVLNQVRHTGNDLADLKQWAKEAYSGEKNYVVAPAVRDGKIITTNDAAALEFAQEIMVALKIAPENKILKWFVFHKRGSNAAPMPAM